MTLTHDQIHAILDTARGSDTLSHDRRPHCPCQEAQQPEATEPNTKNSEPDGHANSNNTAPSPAPDAA